MAQLPVIGLLTGQSRAMDAALLSRAHADDLAILHVAHAVGLCVFQGNQAQHKIALLRVGQGFIFGHHIFQHAAVDLQVVAALLKGNAVHLLVFQGNRHVVGIDGNDIIIAALLGF